MGPHIDRIVEAFKGTGIDVGTTDRVQNIIWSKLLLNTNMAVAATLNITNDQYLYYPSVRKLVTLLGEECAQVAQAMGVDLEHPQDPVAPLITVMEKFRDSGLKPKCSMYQDMLNKRKTEIDTIHGSVVREGKNHNVPTPVTEVMILLVKALEEINARSMEQQ